MRMIKNRIRLLLPCLTMMLCLACWVAPLALAGETITFDTDAPLDDDTGPSQADVARMEAIRAQYETYRAEYERLKDIGYGGQTLRKDLADLADKVAALAEALGEVGSAITEGMQPLLVASGAVDSLDNRRPITQVPPKTPFMLYWEASELPPEVMQDFRFALTVSDSVTGKELKVYRSGLNWRYDETTRTTLMWARFGKGYGRTGPYSFSFGVAAEGREPLYADAIHLEVMDTFEPMDLHMAPQQIAEKDSPLRIGLPEGFTPPYDMVLRYEVLSGYEGIVPSALPVHKGPQPLETLPIEMWKQHNGLRLKNIRTLPTATRCDGRGEVQAVVVVTDAEGRRARGEARVRIETAPPTLDSVALLNADGEPVTRMMAGETVALHCMTAGETDGPRFLSVEVTDVEKGSTISSGRHEFVFRDMKVAFPSFSWHGARNVQFTVSLEDEDGKVYDQSVQTLGIEHEKLVIDAPSTIMAIKKIPFSLRVPDGFQPPIKWVGYKGSDMVGAWSASLEAGGSAATGTRGILFGHARGNPGSGTIEIMVADATGRVAEGSKSIYVELNPEEEKGVFDDVGEILGGMAEGFAIAAGEMAEEGGQSGGQSGWDTTYAPEPPSETSRSGSSEDKGDASPGYIVVEYSKTLEGRTLYRTAIHPNDAQGQSMARNGRVIAVYSNKSDAKLACGNSASMRDTSCGSWSK